jgi:uncharacterized protein
VSAEYSELAFKSGDATLRAYLWRPQSSDPALPHVLMSHGLTNNHADAPLFGDLRERLLTDGMPVFMFDYFGSGGSDGAFQDKTWSNQRQNLADAIDFLRTEVMESPGRIAVFGRSVGATLCGFFLRLPEVSCAAMVSTPVSLEAVFGRYRSRAIDGYVSMPEDLERSGQIRGEWKLPVQFFSELAAVEGELRSALRGATGVLVVQGLADAKVPVDEADRLFAELAEPKQLARIAAADHYYTGQEQEVVELVSNWFRREAATS